MSYELIFPVDDANKALRDGKVDFVGGSAHSTLAGFPEWEGAKLICALSQGMYWFLVARKDLEIALGNTRSERPKYWRSALGSIWDCGPC